MNPISYIRPFVAAAALYVASITACAPVVGQSKSPSAAVSPASQDYAALEQQALKELGTKNRGRLRSSEINGEYFFFQDTPAVHLLAGICAGNAQFEVRGKDVYVVSSFTEATSFDEGVGVTQQRNKVIASADRNGNGNHITAPKELSDLAFQIFLKGGKCE